jgi:lipopolysaccharide export system protein LptA
MSIPAVRLLLRLVTVAMMAAPTAAVRADRSDRGKPLTLESDKPCTVELARQVSVCSGNVVIAQGSLQIRAERVELRETPDGYRHALAIGTPAAPATYRQRRDGSDEYVEGSAERVEYDARADTLRFIGNATVKRLRGGTPSEEIQGSLIVWDNNAELFTVQGGAPTPGNPSGRVRAVLAPREGAASAPAPAASTAPLRPSANLGERK